MWHEANCEGQTAVGSPCGQHMQLEPNHIKKTLITRCLGATELLTLPKVKQTQQNKTANMFVMLWQNSLSFSKPNNGVPENSCNTANWLPNVDRCLNSCGQRPSCTGCAVNMKCIFRAFFFSQRKQYSHVRKLSRLNRDLSTIDVHKEKKLDN